MQINEKVKSLTFDQYAHLPSAIHKLVVDALVERGEWRLVNGSSKIEKEG